jgi:butyryl-CoA dehydrogenase
MDALLSNDNLEWKAKARKLADEVIRPRAWKYDRLQEYPWEIKDAMVEAGIFGVWIPKEYGGAGAGLLNLCVVVEELSRACGGIGVAYCVNALATFPVILGGTEEQKHRYLPSVAKGERLCAFGLSERNAGSDAGGMTCRAEDKGDHYILNGGKKWNTNGGISDLYSIFAVTDPESRSRRISCFMVDKGAPGFTVTKIEDKLGIRCVPVVEIDFKDTKVPLENLLGGKPGLGFKHAMMTLDQARPGVAAQAVGLAQGALDLATRYAMGRKQFGQPVSSFQMVQQMLADMAMKIEASRQLVYAAARAVDLGQGGVTKIAAMAKCFATDTAVSVCTDAVQIFGGYGYMRDYPIEKYYRDAKILQIYEGTNQVQRLVIARNLLKEADAISHLDEYIPLKPEHMNTD